MCRNVEVVLLAVLSRVPTSWMLWSFVVPAECQDAYALTTSRKQKSLILSCNISLAGLGIPLVTSLRLAGVG